MGKNDKKTNNGAKKDLKNPKDLKNSKKEKNSDELLQDKEKNDEGFSKEKVQEVLKQNEELQNQILSLQSLVKENEEFIKRQKAEFDNYRKRSIDEKEQLSLFAGEKILQGFLKIYDSYSKALDIKVDQNNMQDFINGFRLIKEEMDKFLHEQNVVSSTQSGDEFDPNIHQAIFFEESDQVEKDLVAEVFQEGYLYHKRLLREAVVKVIKPSASTESTAERTLDSEEKSES